MKMALSLVVIVLTACSTPRAHTDNEWPQRPLMEAPFENSLMSRYLAKPVHESALVDDMETDYDWTVVGRFASAKVASVGYTTDRAHDGKRSLRFRSLMRDIEFIKSRRNPANGSFDGYTGGITMAVRKFEKPQDWSKFNRISLWVYVHPAPMRAYSSLVVMFECEGATKGNQAPLEQSELTDLKPGEWNHFVWEIPQYQRDKVTSLTFYQKLRGDDSSGGDTPVTYDIDQVEVQRVDVEAYEGWAVAPGRIAYQQVGYLPLQEKVAFASDVSETQFEVVDAASGAAASFPVKTVTNKRGKFQILDFTNFTKPGRYVLRVGTLTTRPFPVSDDIWYGTIEKALNFFYGERCGFDVPQVHAICHLDLQGRGPDGTTKIINGGWHDASQMAQSSSETGLGVYSMLLNYDQLRQRNLRPDLQARLLEEARWGLDWLLKTRFGKGHRVTRWTERIYTDNKLGTPDDVIADARNSAYENFLFSAVAANASRILKDVDPQRAARSLQAAVEDYGAALEQRSDRSDATREEAAFGALASAELYKADGGKPIYAERAAQFGRLVSQIQEQRFADGIPLAGYFYEDTRRLRIVHDYRGSSEEAPLMALRALCETFPQNPDWIEWYGAVLLHSEYFYQRGAVITEPYRRLPNSVWRRGELDLMVDRGSSGREFITPIASETDREKVREEVFQVYNAGTRLTENARLLGNPIYPQRLSHGTTLIQLAGTAALTAAAQLRNTPDTESLARRQLHWVFGGNPFSQSLMYGEGYDYMALEVYSLRNLVGAIASGMESLGNDAPAWPSMNFGDAKSVWGLAVSKALYNLAYAGMPARITGSAPAGAKFRESRTNTTVNIRPGRISLNIAPGDYTIEYGKASRKITLIGGGRYQLSLDPKNAIDMSLSSNSSNSGVIEVTAHVRGAGAHKLELRAFNGSASTPQAEVNLTEGREQIVTWSLKVADNDKAWVAVVIADGDVNSRYELFGTVRRLAPIE